MDEGRALWEKYCGFFAKTFSEQAAYTEKQNPFGIIMTVSAGRLPPCLMAGYLMSMDFVAKLQVPVENKFTF